MEEQWISIVGSIAAFLTTVSFVPQVIRTFKTRDVEGISLLMYAAFVFGIILWLIYGIVRADLPIIIGNAVTFVLASTVLVLKILNVTKRKDL